MASVGGEQVRSQVQLPLGELLVQLGFIDNPQLDSALAEQRRTGHRLGKILVDRGIITEARLVRALSRQLGINVCDPIATPVHERVRALIPRDLAYRYRAVPIGLRRTEEGDVLYVATADPLNRDMVTDLEAASGARVGLLLAGETELDLALARHYGTQPPAFVLQSRSAPPPRAQSRAPSGGGIAQAPSSGAVAVTFEPSAEAARVPSRPPEPLPSAAKPLLEETGVIASEGLIAVPPASPLPLLAEAAELLPEATGSLPDTIVAADESVPGLIVEEPVEAAPPPDESWGSMVPGTRSLPPVREPPEVEAELVVPVEEALAAELRAGDGPRVSDLASPPALPRPGQSADLLLNAQGELSIPPPATPVLRSVVEPPSLRARVLLDQIARGDRVDDTQVRWLARVLAEILLDGRVVDPARLDAILDRVGLPR